MSVRRLQSDLAKLGAAVEQARPTWRCRHCQVRIPNDLAGRSLQIPVIEVWDAEDDAAETAAIEAYPWPRCPGCDGVRPVVPTGVGVMVFRSLRENPRGDEGGMIDGG